MGDHYMVLAELMAHKRIDVAVRAFGALGLPLLVVGDGPELRRLRRMAGPTVSFTGRISDERVADLLARARALVVTATEEFGIAAVEALAAGRPVIALGEGGVRESVVEGVTGTFFERCEPEALAEAVRRFDPLSVDPRACRARGRAFRRRAFPPAAHADRLRGGARGARAAAWRAVFLPRPGGRSEAPRRPTRRIALPKSCLSP